MLKEKLTKTWRPLIIFLEVFGFSILVFSLYNLVFWERIYPGISVAGIPISGLKPEEAKVLISKSIAQPEKIILTYQDQIFEITLNAVDFSYDFSGSAYAAYRLDRTGNVFYDFAGRASAPLREKNIGLRINLNEEKLKQSLSVIAGQVSTEAIYPSASIVLGKVVVEKGTKGEELNTKKLRIIIGQSLAFAKGKPIVINTKVIDPTLTDEEVDSLRVRAENLVGKRLTLAFENDTFNLVADELFGFLDPKNEYQEEKITEYVLSLATNLNREPQNPTFVFQGGRVEEFAPAKDGIAIKEELLKEKIIGNLRTLETSDEKLVSVLIPSVKTSPSLKTEDVNNLGIKELIGRGTSRFRGSIAPRIFNISLAASRLNGVLIKPGEVFSFNQALGDISKFTGYKEAFIIKDGKTILGDGGGVCQVSTTFFRAVLGTGLPVVERRAHSYRVAYYEQDSAPGFDATIYAPTTDLKIKNDTPGHILIQAQFDRKNYTLVFEFYGTSDGRVAMTTKPITTNLVEPPEDRYQDDPTLPTGTVKQIDWKAWGGKNLV